MRLSSGVWAARAAVSTLHEMLVLVQSQGLLLVLEQQMLVKAHGAVAGALCGAP